MSARELSERRRTKIVCTLGPASRSPEVLREMVRAGVDVVRLNFSHGTHEQHAAMFAEARRLAAEEGRTVAVMQDLSGPKLRIGELRGGSVHLEAGHAVELTGDRAVGDETRIPVPVPELPATARPGDRILLGDGQIELEVEAVEAGVRCQVVLGGELGSHKGFHLLGRSLPIATLTAKDREDLKFGVELGVDVIAVSFVRSAADVEEARRLARGWGAEVPIVAKLEKHEAVEDLEAILDAADGVMVARGDLGIEVSLKRVPILQKQIIAAANRRAKPVITATQMLMSMVEQPRPTRAEVADVANAILDGTDAVMLSEESAVGQYPVEAVRTMAEIAVEVERTFPFGAALLRREEARPEDIAGAVSRAVNVVAQQVGADAIVPCTLTGGSARRVAAFRPRARVVAASPRLTTVRTLALVWGVVPVYVEEEWTTTDVLDKARQAVLAAGLVGHGDIVVYTGGMPVASALGTNMLLAEVVEQR